MRVWAVLADWREDGGRAGVMARVGGDEGGKE